MDLFPRQYIIRDRMYGYIRCCAIEIKFINSPYFQRLRHIKQNGLAHYVYPTCLTTRFEHSLGVLETGTDLIENALGNSSTRTREEFVDKFRDVSLLRVKFAKLIKVLKVETKTEQADVVKQLLVEAVRLACLLHDVGHLPLSHIMEKVVRCVSSGGDGLIPLYKHIGEEISFFADDRRFKLKIHEVLSYKIAKEIYKTFCQGQKGKNNREWLATELALRAALCILNYPMEKWGSVTSVRKRPEEKDEMVFVTIRGILDGEIDADRFDFLVRDSQLAGVASSEFDGQRVLECVELVRPEAGGLKFEILPSIKALSAIESFYTNRHQELQYLVNHPVVVFFDELLKFLLVRTFWKNGVLHLLNTHNRWRSPALNHSMFEPDQILSMTSAEWGF